MMIEEIEFSVVVKDHDCHVVTKVNKNLLEFGAALERKIRGRLECRETISGFELVNEDGSGAEILDNETSLTNVIVRMESKLLKVVVTCIECKRIIFTRGFHGNKSVAIIDDVPLVATEHVDAPVEAAQILPVASELVVPVEAAQIPPVASEFVVPNDVLLVATEHVDAHVEAAQILPVASELVVPVEAAHIPPVASELVVPVEAAHIPPVASELVVPVEVARTPHVASEVVDREKRKRALSISDAQPYFELTLHEAVKELGICKTVVKKACRSWNINRWPGRKVRSLINNITALEVAIEEVAGEELSEKKSYMQSLLVKLQSEKHEILNGTPTQVIKAMGSKTTTTVYKLLYKL